MGFSKEQRQQFEEHYKLATMAVESSSANKARLRKLLWTT
jgi:hypothetical protein